MPAHTCQTLLPAELSNPFSRVIKPSTQAGTLGCKCFIPLCSRKINRCRISRTMDSQDRDSTISSPLCPPSHQKIISSLLCPWNSICFHLCPCSHFLHGCTTVDKWTPSISFPAIRDFCTSMTSHCPFLSPGSPSSPNLSSRTDCPALSISWLSCVWWCV